MILPSSAYREGLREAMRRDPRFFSWAKTRATTAAVFGVNCKLLLETGREHPRFRNSWSSHAMPGVVRSFPGQRITRLSLASKYGRIPFRIFSAGCSAKAAESVSDARGWVCFRDRRARARFYGAVRTFNPTRPSAFGAPVLDLALPRGECPRRNGARPTVSAKFFRHVPSGLA